MRTLRRAFAVAIVSVAALLLTGTAFAETTFTDPAGDAGTAPDITQVVVSDAVGLISFRVTVPLVPSTDLELFLNTDRNAVTGKDGDELYVAVGINADGSKWYDVSRWNGSAWEDFSPTTIRVSSTSTAVEIVVGQAEFGVTSGVAFLFESERWVADALEATDDAPGGTLPWEYTPAKAAPPTPRLTIGKPATIPLRLVAGRRAALRFPLSGAPTAGAVMSSVTTVAGKKIASTATLSGGAARVALQLPRSAGGKKLVVRVTVTIGGTATTRTAAVTVARAVGA